MTPEQLAASGTESGHQRAVFCWAALNVVKYPELKWMHAIPNGGKRDKITGGVMKAEGVKAGVADIFLPCARKSWHGLYIEMKKDKGIISKEQQQFIDYCQDHNYGAVVCYNWQSAVTNIEGYLNYGS